MWSEIDLRWRLSLGFCAVLGVCLVAGVALMLRDARSAAEREAQASLATATQMLDALLDGIDALEPAQAQSALLRWREALAGSRHVCFALDRAPRDAEPSICRQPQQPVGVPQWFARGVGGADEAVVSRVVAIGGERYRIELAADASDEIAEAWSETRSLVLVLLAMAFAANLLAFAMIGRSLRPLTQIQRALERLREGDFAAPSPRLRSPELRALADGVRRLAEALSRSRSENQRLTLRNLELQEQERRLIAQELHDEIGQHVAAIDAETAGLMRQADERQRSLGLRRIRASVAEVHRVSRALLQRLRPAALDSLGLSATLRELVEQWRMREREWQCEAEIDPACDRLAPQSAIQVYRIVQESLANVSRHAQASAVLVRVAMDAAQAQYRIEIADNGRGFDPHCRSAGLGLLGIRERVEALGGRMHISSRRGVGSRLQADLPLHA